MGGVLFAESMGYGLDGQGELRGATLVERITHLRASSLPFAAPKHVSQTTEAALVREVLQVLQGYSTCRLPWNEEAQQFYVRNGIYVADLSQSSLHHILQIFSGAATSLRRVELFVRSVLKDTNNSWLKHMSQAHPTLEAFASAVSMRLEFLPPSVSSSFSHALVVSQLVGFLVRFVPVKKNTIARRSSMPGMRRVCPPPQVYASSVLEVERGSFLSLRKAALEKELEAATFEGSTRVTLLSLSANLSRVFAGAEFLEHIVDVAVPEPDRLLESKFSAAELATHILSALYKELDAFCLLQDGEDDAYGTALLLLVGCIRPMIESLDTWLQEGILSDPAGELFFYEDESVPIEDSAFWESHFQLRNHSTFSEQDSRFNSPFQSPGSQRDASFTALESTSPGGSSRGLSGQKLLNTSIDSTSSLQADSLQYMVCPSFLKPLGKAILSAGKSLQLLQYARREPAEGNQASTLDIYAASKVPSHILPDGFSSLVQILGKEFPENEGYPDVDSLISSQSDPSDAPVEERISLYEQFCASLLKLLGETSNDETRKMVLTNSETTEQKTLKPNHNIGDELFGVVLGTHRSKVGGLDTKQGISELECEEESHRTTSFLSGFDIRSDVRQNLTTVSEVDPSGRHDPVSGPTEKYGTCAVKGFGAAFILARTAEVPGEQILKGWLNLAGYCQLPALDDIQLRGAVFRSGLLGTSPTSQDRDAVLQDERIECRESTLCTVTNFNDGLGCGKLLLVHEQQNLAAIEKLLPFPTILPSFEEKCHVSGQLPFRVANRQAVRVLERLQTGSFNTTPAPTILFQECLTSFIQKQVDGVGRQLLAKLMGEWRLMEELALLRAIYLVGSGDLLQQFASVLFNKLDRGEPWDDFYELNTMLQESVRSSSHGVAIPALDSLVATVLPRSSSNAERGPGVSPGSLQIGGRAPSFGIDTLDSLFFTYKVAWPLELIIDSSAIKKYNQVMVFLLKVKRAKHALDKACRWTWKNGVGDAALHKQRLLLQQKLMHFVNTLHQYVMDRVLYSAWVELCEGMSSAGSLDEVKSCHDSYLVSIQRQCLVAPDKLWTLIASRVKTILGLALNYYSIQRLLCDGVGASAVSARCQLEIERVEKQFDECMVFLMRVLSFKLNVGHFPHLADLVTRINYNYYYMTEDGQLSTPVPDAHALTARRTARRL